MSPPHLSVKGLLKTLWWEESVPAWRLEEAQILHSGNNPDTYCVASLKLPKATVAGRLFCLITLYSIKCGLHNIFIMPWLPNESSSIIGKNTCVHDQGTVSSKPGGRHTDRFLPTFLLSDFMITTHNICPRHWSGKLNPCKILSLCAGIFTFWNYFKLIAFRETRPLITFWKFLILSIIYFQCMLEIGWLLRAFLGMMIGLVVIAVMPFPWHGFPIDFLICCQSFLVLKCGISTN